MILTKIGLCLLLGVHRRDFKVVKIFLTPVFVFEHRKEICLFHDVISKHGDNFCVYILFIDLQVLNVLLMYIVSFLSCRTAVCPLALQLCCQTLRHVNILRLEFVTTEENIEVFR